MMEEAIHNMDEEENECSLEDYSLLQFSLELTYKDFEEETLL